MKTSILIPILIVIASTVNNCNGTKTTASDPKVAQTINKRQLPDTISLRLDDLDSLQNNEVKQSEDEDYSDYYDSEDYKAFSRITAVEPDLSCYHPISYFWYDINLDGKEELWVIYFYDDGHSFGWILSAYEVDKKRHFIKEMGMADIPRFSQIHRGKGYLIVTRGKWGYEEWYKIYWNNGIKRDFIYEKNYYGCENYEYVVPKEPLLQTTEYYGYLTDLVMTKVFGIWDDD